MNPRPLMMYVSALAPVAMSLAALAAVLAFLVSHGPAPQADEGTAAQVWQFLKAAQVPIVLFFALRWVPEAPRQAVPVLALQIVAGLAAMAPVYLLHW